MIFVRDILNISSFCSWDKSSLTEFAKIQLVCPKNIMLAIFIPDLQKIFSVESTGVKAEKCYNLPFPKVFSVKVLTFQIASNYHP